VSPSDALPQDFRLLGTFDDQGQHTHDWRVIQPKCNAGAVPRMTLGSRLSHVTTGLLFDDVSLISCDAGNHFPYLIWELELPASRGILVASPAGHRLFALQQDGRSCLGASKAQL